MITPGFDPEFAAAADWARLYRANGVQVVPSKNKIPQLKSWKEYQNELVPDELFEKWYGPGGQFAQSYNMGALTGSASGRLLMIDLDLYKGPEAAQWWQGVLAVHNSGMEIETWEQITGGGGRQMFYTYPPNWKFAVNAKTDLNIDIRCQGGFAVLPPTQHETGRNYTWVDGASPWEIPIALAPDWLLEEVERLIREHGGGHAQNAQNAQNAQTPNVNEKRQTGNGEQVFVAGQYDAFGHQTDGRESFMRDLVWGSVVDWHRECPIKPSDMESAAKAGEKYGVYEAQVSARGTGPTKTAALDAEGRGPIEFWAKWQHAMKLWDSKVAEEARKPGSQKQQKAYADYSDEFAKAKTDPGKPLILTGADFLKAFRPPDYLVDGVMQRGGLYAVTARTGHGKTAVAMLMALCVARGTPFHTNPAEQGSVLFFAGENSDDIRARYTVTLDTEGAKVEDVPLYFIDGVINIHADMDRIRTDAGAIPNLSLIIIDTKQAYFLGDDGNSNEQQVQFARLGRELIKLPGHPAVVFLCHPIKNAGRDNLVPMGGSAFLNEIDFNFTLWADERVCKLNPHPDKWRGPAFEELAFELKQQSSTMLKDSKGREIPSVIAVPISEAGAERREAVATEDEKQILRLIYADKNASMAGLARRASWFQPNGEPAKSKVARVIARLLESKFVYRFHRTRYRLTKKGCKHINGIYKNDDDDDE